MAAHLRAGIFASISLLFIVSALFMQGCGGSSASAGGGGRGNPPATPTGLAATPSNHQVSLTWNTTTTASSYNVKRSTTSGGPYTHVANATVSNDTDTGLANGTTYYYVVSAVNANGESANSSEVSGTPNIPPPAVPTGLTATAANLQVALAWNAITGATSYNVKRATTTGGPYAKVGSSTVATYTETGLSNGTAYYYVVSAVNANGESGNSTEASATPVTVSPDVTVIVDPTQTKPISPWIYGINFYSGVTGAPAHLTFDRAGGNRWTAYNWETNASNAGSDYIYNNDNYLSSSNVPAEAVRSFVAGDQGFGLASLVTVQLQGLVSADESGQVSVTNPPDMTRFKTVVDKKITISSVPFTTSPDTSDAFDYMDEFVWAMDQKLPGIFDANPTLPTFVSLDNEPELWNSTHLEVQGKTPVSSDNYIAKTITLTKALKDQFPNLVIFGPVHYGFQGLYNWQGELSATPDGTNWFPDKYLPAIKTASDAYGKPLVDVYDFHWYPEIYDANGTRILDLTGTTLTDAQVQLIVQGPRDLWDPTFNDDNNSNPWIFQELGHNPIRIVPRLQAKINSEFPGMRGISMTEYEGGGWNHIAGTLAQADMLGIFGAQGLFAANLWPPNGTYDYALAGFRVFRGFDGANANFGDTSVQATSSDVSKVAVYASTDSTAPGRVVFAAINRSTAAHLTAISGLPLSGMATVYQITAASAQGQTPVHPVLVGQMPVGGQSFTVTLPALSVSTIEVK
jgi:Glycoside hydrolase family 44